MTGPAKFAWIIAILITGIIMHIPAHAAAPRDAIRKLPSITSTTRWITQNDNEELFQAVWDINWNSGDIRAGAFNSRLSFDYQLNLQDNQDANGNFTRNIRGDTYRFRMDLQKLGYMTANYQFQHIEGSSDRSPSQGRRTQDLTDIKTAYLELAPKDAPRFTVTTQEHSSVNYNGFNLNRGNDSIYWKGFAEHRGNTARGGYNVQFTNESSLRRELTGINEQSSSNGKFQVIGSSDMLIGSMGRLQMQALYVEDSTRNNRQDSQVTNTVMDYTLNFGGDLPGYPLNYGYRFKVKYDGNLDGATNRRTERLVTLNYRPPMPEGRRMSIVYLNNLQDFDNPNNSTASTIQNLTIEFMPNPRTQANVIYRLQQDFNNLAKQMTRDFTQIEGNLDYTMPGNRTRYHMGMQQQQNIAPNRRDKQEYSKYTYRASSAMGQRANVSMEISQAYDDSFNSARLTSTPTDTLQTRVVYDFSGQMAGRAGGSFNLNAIWERNLLRRALSEQKNDQHILRINLAYNTNANWRYELHLQSGEGWSYNGDGEFTERYSNSDRIEAMVKHTF